MPDADLLAIQARVNKETKRGRITIGIRVHGENPQYYVIFQYRSRRATITLNDRPTEGNVDEFVTALESWSGDADVPQYTYDPPLPPASEWA